MSDEAQLEQASDLKQDPSEEITASASAVTSSVQSSFSVTDILSPLEVVSNQADYRSRSDHHHQHLEQSGFMGPSSPSVNAENNSANTGHGNEIKNNF